MLDELTETVATGHRVTVLESDQGRISLTRDRFGNGYQLHKDAEGFGAGSVENELTPRRGYRGSMLGEQHAESMEMFLPIIVTGEHSDDVGHRVDELTRVLKLAEGVVTVARVDPATGQGRFRRAAYKRGLDTPQWRSPTAVLLGVTLDVMDPWAYGLPQTVSLVPTASAYQGGWEVPFDFPLSATGTSVPTAVRVTNTGVNPAPLKVTFYGPSTNPRAWTGEVEVQYRGRLAHDEWVTVSGLDMTVLLGGGGRDKPVPVPGRISPHTMLSELTVPVGGTEWWYEAVDDTAQSKAEFTWWDAYQTMR